MYYIYIIYILYIFNIIFIKLYIINNASMQKHFNKINDTKMKLQEML